MLGNSTSDDMKGLVPRICQGLLQKIQMKKDSEQQEPDTSASRTASTDSIDSKSASIKTIYSVQVSYCEIYMERVKDLLEPEASGDGSTGQHRALRVREHPVTGPFVEGLVVRNVNSYAEVRLLIGRPWSVCLLCRLRRNWQMAKNYGRLHPR